MTHEAFQPIRHDQESKRSTALAIALIIGGIAFPLMATAAVFVFLISFGI